MVHSSEEQIALGSTSGRIIHGHLSTTVGLPRKSEKCSLFSLKAATLVARRRLLILFHDGDHPLSLCFFFALSQFILFKKGSLGTQGLYIDNNRTFLPQGRCEER